MAEVSYPVHMYKDLHRPRYAHTRKEQEALMLDNWTDVRVNIGPQSYPKALHNEAGNVRIVGNYDKDGVVNLEQAEAEELQAAEEGYGEQAIAPKEVTIAVPAENQTRIEKLEADLAAAMQAIKVLSEKKKKETA